MKTKDTVRERVETKIANLFYKERGTMLDRAYNLGYMAGFSEANSDPNKGIIKIMKMNRIKYPNKFLHQQGKNENKKQGLENF